jgi:hypothetical protein
MTHHRKPEIMKLQSACAFCEDGLSAETLLEFYLFVGTVRFIGTS